MKATEALHDRGQSLWLDNITRDLLDEGHAGPLHRRTLGDRADVQPHDFDHAIKNSSATTRLSGKGQRGQIGRGAVLRAALEDLTGAADCFDRSGTGRAAWTAGCRSRCRRCWPTTHQHPAAAKALHARAGGRTSSSRSPAPGRLPAIEEAIFAGIPINVTLLFSHDQYLAAADAFMRSIERRVAAGLQPEVGSVASVFISRWDAAVKGRVPDALRNQLGIAMAKRTYKAYRTLLDSPRWQRVFNTGARPQRLLWASTGTKDPGASDVLYIRALAAPFTVNTMPEGTLKALADHGSLGEMLPADGGDSEEALARFARAGVDVDALATQLQDEGAKSSSTPGASSWR